MVSYLSRIFGMARLDLAEDVVQDTLCRALESWPVHGLPDNPSAWLMRAARNRAIDLIRRDRQYRYFEPELVHLFKLREPAATETPAFEQEIRDGQLRMMFSCCHAGLSTESQVTLILKTLCGFSVAEIAHALLTHEDAIEKRLGRARKLFRESEIMEEFSTPEGIAARIEAVYQAIYLLFNEGYHGSQAGETVREDLCSEAIRLALLLSGHPQGNKPKTFALLALFCFHAARLDGRIAEDGSLIQLEMQDRSTWDSELIARGFRFFEQSSAGQELSTYHVEAAIASLHSAAPAYDQTDWVRILELYDLLYRLEPSPIVALNRAIAMGNALGAERGLLELKKLSGAEPLGGYPFFPAAQARFLRQLGRVQEAAAQFEQARSLARSQAETEYFARELQSLRHNALLNPAR